MPRNEIERVAFLGLGVMGYPMAGHLAQNGFELTVYNRTESVTDRWLKEYSGHKATSPAEAASNAQIVMTCVGNDDDVRQIYSGQQGIFSGLAAGSVCIDHTTTSAQLAEEMAAAAKSRGLSFLDAPVSGGQAGAEQGILTIMVGGDELAFAAAQAVMRNYAKVVQLVGKSGDGQRCKMVNQICVAGVLQGLSEGLELAKHAGFSPETILNTLQHGAGSSWQMVNRTQSMMEGKFDFGFAVDWMRKDLGICMQEAARFGLDLPMTKMVDEAYQRLQEKGYQRSDTSVLIKQFES